MNKKEPQGSVGRTTGKIGTPVEPLVMPLGMSKVPMGWPVMAQAFIDFAMWAIGQPGFLKAFEESTGIKYRPPRDGLEKMIDDVTGANKHIVSQFLDWLTVNHWGEA